MEVDVCVASSSSTWSEAVVGHFHSCARQVWTHRFGGANIQHRALLLVILLLLKLKCFCARGPTAERRSGGSESALTYLSTLMRQLKEKYRASFSKPISRRHEVSSRYDQQTVDT